MNGRPDHDPDAHVLADRLTTGWIMCDREPDPERKEQLERHWLSLLRQYERACDGGSVVPAGIPVRTELSIRIPNRNHIDAGRAS